MIISPNLGLDIWDQSTDPYSHQQLASNFTLIDDHDHTPNKGVRLTSGSIANNQIIWQLIAAGAVQGSAGNNGTNIAAGSITATEIANGTLTATQFANSVFSSIDALGTVKAWWRPNGSISLPNGYVLLDGSTYGPGQHDFPVGSITIPDLRNRFILGCDPNNSGDGGPNVAPGEDVSGGSNAQNLAHTHPIDAHTHTLSHTHAIGSHAHSISFDGAHFHTYAGSNDMHTRTNAFLPGLQFTDTSSNIRQNTLQSTYIENVAPAVGNDLEVTMDGAGNHNHGGSTGGSGTLTTGDASSTMTSSTSLNTNGASPSPPSDFRPNYYGLLYIIRIKSE